jgi:hypothetical protein
MPVFNDITTWRHCVDVGFGCRSQKASYHERIRVQFRAEAFNHRNTPQFAWPDTAFGSPTFGVVSGTMNVGPRNVKFGLKVDFGIRVQAAFNRRANVTASSPAPTSNAVTGSGTAAGSA